MSESERKYSLQLTDDQIIFLAEMLVAGHCSAIRVQLRETRSNGYSIMAPMLEETVRENVRDLLREPLRDLRFREELKEYFSRHPNETMREFGWNWLEEVLVWES